VRQLATIRKIDEIRSIPDADAIECAVVGGWTVVVRKGEFAIGDWAVYCEIDSWIPTNVAPFLSKGREPREFEGVKGERLRTIKLRGQISQGLLLKVEWDEDLAMAGGGSVITDKDGCLRQVELTEDVNEALGILKWEASIPAELAGMVKGGFPGFMPKTDQERIQNLMAEFEDWKVHLLTWEGTEKLDGTSMTAFYNDGNFGVCGRNWELIETQSNSLWRAVRSIDLEQKLRIAHNNIALQGELIGEGIQGNPYKLKGQQFFVYDIYDIDRGVYFNAFIRATLVRDFGLNHAPFEYTNFVFPNDITVGSLLKLAEGKSALNSSTEREGLVFKCIEDPSISFKVISNRFLLREK